MHLERSETQMNEIDEKIEVFEQKLGAQAELYRTLIGLARAQADKISAEDVDALMRFLEKKKVIIDEIEQVGATAEPLRQFWESHKDEVAEPVRERLKAVVDEIRALLEELMEIEEAGRRKLGITKDEVESQMQQLSAGPRAMRSYAPGRDQNPRFMDHTG
jgi:stage III sporulation protein SpoIIIAA